MSFLTTLGTVGSLFLLIFAGFLVKKLNLVSEKFSKDISNFLFYVSIPCTMISSMESGLTPEKLTGAVKMLIYSVAIIVGGAVVSKLLIKLLRETDEKKLPVYEFALTISNYGFMGWPISYALFGDTGLLYSSVFGIFINIIFYFYGGMVFGKSEKKATATRLTSIINPPLIGTVIGLVLFLTNSHLPGFLDDVTGYLSGTTTPLAMAVAGMILANNRLKDMVNEKKVFVYCAIRLLILPMTVFLVLKALGESGLSLAIPVLITAMPAPANVTVLTEFYKADSYLGAKIIFISTLLSMLTIPMIVALTGV